MLTSICIIIEKGVSLFSIFGRKIIIDKNKLDSETSGYSIFVDNSQKMKFPVKGFLSLMLANSQELRIYSHLLNRSLTQNVMFCAVWNFLI